MADPKAALGSTEIAILRYVSDHHPITVGEVAEYVAQTTGQARTTVLTIMERLRRKRYLTRKRIDGVFRYAPKIAKNDLLHGLVKDFVDTTLGGSLSPFVTFLSEGGPISNEDFETLKRLVCDLDQQRCDLDQQRKGGRPS
jgi:predicted transcriptional regulator